MPHTITSPSLAYNQSGPADAPPVVLIGGLGSAQAAWMLQVRALSARLHVVTYDHRGTGESELMDVPVTMADYANDLLGLLDQLGLARAHLVGLSFGGRVAMTLALLHPARVSRLVLGGTSCSDAGYTRGAPGGVESLRSPPLSDPDAEQARWENAILPYLFGRAYRERHPERLRNLARWRARHPTDPRGLQRQWEAFRGFDVCGRLHEIQAPTMILHGDEDAVSSVENAHVLARGIPGSRLEILPGVGHSPNVEAPERMNALLLEHLLA